MKISCLRSDLATAISNVSRAVSTKASIPALEGVLIKAYGNTLNISGYNLEIGITTDIEATIKEEGEIVVSAKLFLDIAYAVGSVTIRLRTVPITAYRTELKKPLKASLFLNTSMYPLKLIPTGKNTTLPPATASGLLIDEMTIK